jgi:hypothetical protein
MSAFAATADKGLLLRYPVFGQRSGKDFKMRQGGCNGDKKGKKESQRQSQGDA